MKKHIGMVLIGLAIVVVLVLYLVSFTVRFKEQALVLSFGKIVLVESEPGLKWTWPWQQVVKLDGRIRTYQPPAQEIQTKDKRNINVSVFVNWRISDPKTFYNTFNEGGTDAADLLSASERKGLQPWIANAYSVFNEYSLGELITLDENKFKLPIIEKGAENQAGMLQRVRERAIQDTGIEVLDLGVRQLGIPDGVSEEVFKRMRDERSREENALLADGRQKAETIVGQANAKAQEILATAESDATRIKGQGDAAAAEHYKAFAQDTDLARFLLQLKTLRTTLTEKTTLVLDSNSPAYKLLSQGPELKPEKPTVDTAAAKN